jgi:hypothetical protein
LKIIFVARLHKHGKDSLGFYVPTNVSEYHDLTEGARKVNISFQPNAKIKDAWISFTKYKTRLRGLIPLVGNFQVLEAGRLVQVTLEVEK